jgi:D-alanyl-D-alanine dipeptidase
LPDGFVYLRDIDPTIAQDMRYAGANNFTGRPLPGYGAAECVLRADTAAALKRAQASLAGNGSSRKVYDCYRPARAVNAMARWTASAEDGSTSRFYPNLQKRTLFAQGWISPRSAHSAGNAIDLTLIAQGAKAVPYEPTTRYGACDAPAAQRAPDSGLDMGSAFDCFSAVSHTANPAITAEQRARRDRLKSAMSRQGFKNYFREWWHFAYEGGAPPGLHDFVVPPHAVVPR